LEGAGPSTVHFDPGATYLLAEFLKLVVTRADGGAKTLLKIAKFEVQPVPLRLQFGEAVTQLRQQGETPGQCPGRGLFVANKSESHGERMGWGRTAKRGSARSSDSTVATSS